MFTVGIFLLSVMSAMRDSDAQDRRPFAPAPTRKTPNRESRAGNPFGGGGNQLGFSGRATVEEYNKLLVDQLFQVTGERDVPDRKKSFDPKEWAGVARLVRVEHSAVPILGKRGWNTPTIDIIGVADAGEILALVNIDTIVALVNPLGQHPDESGTWYQVRLLDGKEGWICAVPHGREASPFARAFWTENGELTDLVDVRSAKAESNVTVHAPGAFFG